MAVQEQRSGQPWEKATDTGLSTSVQNLEHGHCEKELKKQNEELKEKAHSGNNLDAFNACNDLLSK